MAFCVYSIKYYTINKIKFGTNFQWSFAFIVYQRSCKFQCSIHSIVIIFCRYHYSHAFSAMYRFIVKLFFLFFSFNYNGAVGNIKIKINSLKLTFLVFVVLWIATANKKALKLLNNLSSFDSNG